MRDRFLWWGCAVYTVIFTLLGALKYAVHRNLVDFGIFQQTIASAFACLCNPLEGSHWAFHFSPILYVLAIAIAVVPSPLTLIALQAAAGALCAPPVYAIVRRRSDRTTARLAALVVWIYPPLAGLIFGDLHENGFAPAAVAWTMYAFDAGRLGWTALFAAATLAIKEDQALFLAFAGTCGAVAYRSDARRARFAGSVAIVSVLVALAFFLVIQPHAQSNPYWQPVRFYAWTGADVHELLTHGLLERVGFLLLIFVPLAFVPLRTRVAILMIPPLVEVLASRMSTTFTLGTHYAGAWLGYAFVAFAAGLGELSGRNRARTALYWCVGLCVLEFLVANPLHPGLNLRAIQPRDVALDAALHELPRDVSVTTQEEAYTHLGLSDPFARLLPESPGIEIHACLVLIDRAYPESARLQEYGAALAGLVASGQYALVMRSGDIEIYRRLTPCR